MEIRGAETAVLAQLLLWCGKIELSSPSDDLVGASWTSCGKPH
jgi:hypothetical protein